MSDATDIPTMADGFHHYGFITGVVSDLYPEPLPSEEPVAQRLYATFVLYAKTSCWVVPDHELFQRLAEHLADAVVKRAEDENYRDDTLSIIKEDGVWQIRT